MLDLGRFEMAAVGLALRRGERMLVPKAFEVRVLALFVPAVSITAIVDASQSADPNAVVLQLYDWERDRLFTLAKGVGGAAVTVFAAIIAATLQNEKDKTLIVSAAYIAAIVVLMLLLWAAVILVGLRRLAEEYSLVSKFLTSR
jgi:Na+/H+-dicarboxylate symporter